MNRYITSTRFWVCWGLLALGLLALSACRSTAPAAQSPTPTTVDSPAQTSTPAATATPASSPTPAAAQVILLALTGSDPTQALALQNVLGELAGQDGLRFETHTDLTSIEFGDQTRLVAAVAPDPGLLNLGSANPGVKFLAVGVPGLQAAQNLSVVGSQGTRPDIQGFLAGYLAAVITPEWRAAVITPAGSTDGQAAQLGFSNGEVFFCGLCRPAYPPFVQYPITAELPSGANPEAIQAVVDIMKKNAVKTVYVYPGADNPALLEKLAQNGVNLIGGTPPPAALKDQWVASIQVDTLAAIRTIWPRLIGGEEAISIQTPIVLTNRNDALFSIGRQRLVEQTLTDLLAGYIDTGVDPQTGQPRQ